MPPVRNLPPVKLPLKTERTHEENQERAYIAASRRSDRSLEARVESARRASEIHKKRTGRSLRVTESDVINEEMYEEEDDDLPAQYRRLTAHLHTQNAQFDRRWQAYLINQVAMRSALGQSMLGNGQSSSLLGNGNGMMSPAQQMPGSPNQAMSPQMYNQSSANFRQSPYRTNQGQTARANVHERSASIATPQGIAAYQNNNSSSMDSSGADERRASTSEQSRPNLKRSASSDLFSPGVKREHTSTPGPMSGLAQFQQSQQTMPSPFTFGSPFNNDDSSNPLSMALPMESQQLLAGASFDMNDPLMAAMMSNPYSDASSYSYNPNAKSGGFGSSNGFDGLNQTLAPSDLTFNKTVDTSSNWNDPPQMPKTGNNHSDMVQDKYGLNNDSTEPSFDDGSWSAFIDDGGMFGYDETTAET